MSIRDFSAKGLLDKIFQEWQGSLKTTPGDYVRSLESGLPSRKRNKGWVVVLQAFIDDSGTGSTEREPFMALAGFISTSEVWAQFSDAWQAELNRSPTLPYFKMNEAFHPNAYSPKNKNPFQGWIQSDINKKVLTFIDIIKSFPLLRISSTLDKREFDSLIINDSDKLIKSNPYILCFQSIVFETVGSQKKHNFPPFPIKFIFDKQGGVGIEAMKMYLYMENEVIPEDAKPYFGSPPSFEDDKIFLPLQAADLYVWLVRRHLLENIHRDISIMRPELEMLQSMKSLPFKVSPADISIYIQQQEMAGIIDNVDEIEKRIDSYGKKHAKI